MMKNQTWIDKFKDRKVGRTLAVYLGTAWVFIEAFNFLIDKYNWNAEILNVLILLVIFGLPASVIFVWFQQKFTRRAILLQVINGLLAISVISYSLVKPNSLNTSQLRLLKFKSNQKMLAQAIRSIAVLPFDNFTGDENQTYLAFGMHDALISELGKLGAIRVISKTSAQAYAGSEKTIREIASELNVDAVVEASMLSVDKNIRVQLKLINAFPDEQQLWSETYDSDMSNILDLYNRVIKKIASEIQLTLSPEQEININETRAVNPEAYKAYLRGMYHINQLTPEGVQKGLEYLHEAVSIDPAEPFAYAGLALGYLEIAHGFFDPGDSYANAEAAIKKAQELDSTIAEVLLAQAEMNIYYYWRFGKAEKDYQRALELNPNLVPAHLHYAFALYLYGSLEDGIRHAEIARNLDPLNPYYLSMLASLYCYAGRYEEALVDANKSLEFAKDYPFGLWVLGDTYLAMGNEEEAIEAHRRLAETSPWFSWALGSTYALTDQREEAEKILHALENAPISNWNAVGLSVIHGALGNMDEAFRWVAYEPHHMWIPWVACMPMWDPLHADPRWKEFVEALDLPD
jgi:TolB-like protein